MAGQNSALDAREVLLLNSRPVMRILARFLWIAAFLLATYSWMVAFEHGFAWDKFQKGFQVEWRNLGNMLAGKTSQEPVTPAPQAPPQG
jgi:hypothetical protein